MARDVGDVHLFLALYGVSGAGKSAALQIIQSLGGGVTLHIKDSTKKLDPGEPPPVDLRLLAEKDFAARKARGEYEIVYQKYGAYYGIRADRFRKAFERKEVHCIIIRDITALEEFAHRYPNTKRIYFHIDPQYVPERLRERGSKRMAQRLKRVNQEYTEFVENNTTFDHVIVNFWEIENAVRQLQRIIDYHRRR